MPPLTADQFASLVSSPRFGTKLRRDVRFVTSTSHLTLDDWAQRELLPITDRTGLQGVLLIAVNAEIFACAYTISKMTANKGGSVQPIICDLCRTWQSGLHAGRLTLMPHRSASATISLLCCLDLDCSRHVRGLTAAAVTSKAHLREDITPQRRIARLQARLSELVDDLQLPSESL